jgi:predicted flavoprotein YhiN
MSDKSSDVIKTLEKELEKLLVNIHKNSEVKEIIIQDGQFKKVILKNGIEITGDAVVIATGGVSYPSTGSTGDGYIFAEQLGHQIIKPIPSLVR